MDQGYRWGLFVDLDTLVPASGRIGHSGEADTSRHPDGPCDTMAVRGLSALGVGVLALTTLLAGCAGDHQANRSSDTTSTLAGATSRPAPSPTWTNRSVPAAVGGLNDVFCPNATQCYAVGGMEYGSGGGWIVASSDGGVTWELLDNTPQGWFDAIACSSATHCIAVGGMSVGQGNAPEDPWVVVTSDGGHQWSPATLPADVGPPSGVACASSNICVAVGSAVARTTDGGTSWTLESSPAGLAAIDSVTCPTASFCIIGGAGPGPGSSSPSMSSVSLDGGVRWSAATVAAGPAGLGEISCANARTCVGLVGSDATNTYGTGFPFVTSDGGNTWTRGSSAVGAAVSCVGNFCLSVGAMWQSATNAYPGDAFVSHEGGRNWTTLTPATPDSLTAVDCPSSTDCVAVGGSFPDGSSGVILQYGS